MRFPTRNKHAMHIDHHIMPLAPGKVLVNPEWVAIEEIPERVPALRDWEILRAPHSDPTDMGFLHIRNACSKWLSINVLSIDEKRVFVEETQRTLIAAMKAWGFEPISCAFRHYLTFGGAFHCATLDVRRRGELRSYCD